MQNHSKKAEMRLSSLLLLFVVIGNFFFSAIFVLSTGFHFYKQRNDAQSSAKSLEADVNKQKLFTLAKFN